jgi:hypothetical protein
MRFKGKENIVFWCEDIPRMEGISWQNSTNIKYIQRRSDGTPTIFRATIPRTTILRTTNLRKRPILDRRVMYTVQYKYWEREPQHFVRAGALKGQCHEIFDPRFFY